MASLLSPFAAPFVPSGGDEAVETEPDGPSSANADLSVEPFTCSAQLSVPEGGSEMWVWPEALHQGGIIPGHMFPAGPPPFMAPYSLPVMNHPHGFYSHDPFASYLYAANAQTAQPLMTEELGGSSFLSNAARRRRRKGRSVKRKEKENVEELENCRPPLKIYAEVDVQTDFPDAISESSTARLPTGLYLGSTVKTPNRRPFDRFEVDDRCPGFPALRSVAVWTAEDLLKTVEPVRAAPPQPPSLFSYAAALKTRPAPPPPVPGPPPVPEPKEAQQKAGEKERRTNQPKSKKKKKKAKSPVIDLAAVKAEEEAARSSNLTAFSGLRTTGETMEEEFPGLGGRVDAPPAVRAAVWTKDGGRRPGLLPVHPTDAAWRSSGPRPLFEAATVRRAGGRVLEAPGERPSLPERPETEADTPGEAGKGAKPGRRPAASGGRTKFIPLFAVGGSGTGSAQAALFRPTEEAAVSRLPEKPRLEIAVTEWPVASKAKTTPGKEAAGRKTTTGKGVNPLDSGVTVKRGKEREKPKAKRPTPMKQIILRERRQKKTRRRQATDGEEADVGAMSCPETGRLDGVSARSDDEQEVASAPEDGAREDGQKVADNWETLVSEKEEEEPEKEQRKAVADASPGLHSRRFRDYCDQMIGKAVNECVLQILTDLVRFQDRLHSRDPVKAKQRRRLVYGIKEVTKHLRLCKIRLVIISPDVEKIESEGGLDDAIRNILELCTTQGIFYVFSLPRRMLGRVCMKAVPVSVVGVFNYDGTERNVRHLQALVDEGRRQYRLVTRIMDDERSDSEALDTMDGTWRMKHSRNASSVSEPISDLPVSGHSRQSSCGGPINLVMRNPQGSNGGDYEADDEDNVL